jgi:uncharacterized RDD family membrane protein YckC
VATPEPRRRWSKPEDTPQAPIGGVVPGNLPLRLAAHVLDNIFLVPAVVLVALWAGAGDVDWNTRNSEVLRDDLEAFFAKMLWPMLGLQLAYFSIFEASAMQATPGKWFLGLAVGDNDGDQLGLIHTTLRTALKMALVALFVPVVLLAFFTQRSQTLYDKLTGTMVVRRHEPGIVPPQAPPIVVSPDASPPGDAPRQPRDAEWRDMLAMQWVDDPKSEP